MTRNDHGEDGGSSDDEGGHGEGIDRRSVLAALGAGPSIALADRVTNLRTDAYGRDGGEAIQEECPPCIDPYAGYLQVAEARDGAQPEGGNIAGTIELRVSHAGVVFGQAGNETAVEGNETVEGNGTTTPEPPAPESGMQQSPDFYFDPVGVRLQPGDAVAFLSQEQYHMVSPFHPRLFGYQQRVPEGIPGFVSPLIMQGDAWFYRFDEPGVYDLMSPLYHGFGMVMRIVVVEEGQGAPEGYSQAGQGEVGLPPIAQAVLDAPELAPQSIVDQGTVAWTDLTVEETVGPAGPQEG